MNRHDERILEIMKKKLLIIFIGNKKVIKMFSNKMDLLLARIESHQIHR